jgi:predicted SAM-dependent methyltransferase
MEMKKAFWNAARRVKSRMQITASSNLKIVIGAGDTKYKDWISTDIQSLNLLNDSDWRSLLKRNSISNLLAEHVWEHLSEAEGLVGARNCLEYLKPGGRLRVAVPDGYNPDPKYIEYVNVGRDGHQVLYNYQSLGSLLEEAGFEIKLLEYFDKSGAFHSNPWDKADGMVGRSIRFDSRNVHGKPVYTSLIMDGIKPLIV